MHFEHDRHPWRYPPSIEENSTDRLTAQAKQLGKNIPEAPQLQPARVWVKEPTDKRSWLGRRILVKKLLKINQVGWTGGEHGMCRRDRKLILRVQPVWDWASIPKSYQKHADLPEYALFVTDIELFPLTPQQAAWLNVKLNNETPIYWGVLEDVQEIERTFPRALMVYP